MLSYEICKQLKEARFPQKTDFGSKFYDSNGNLWLENLSTLKLPEKDCLCPTISELIEVCGEIVLWKWRDNWFSGFGENKEVGENHIDDSWDEDEEKGKGQSPEEAVANLWLKIKSKKNKG